jgi:hypothetical protein
MLNKKTHLTAIFFLLCASLFNLYLVLKYAHYGFDLTDEGFYLNWISSPYEFKASISQFGFIYHPIYLLIKGDVALLRIVNYLITFSLSTYLSYLVIGKFFVQSFPCRYVFRASFSIIIGTVSLLITAFELPQSPSYNTLTFQALLIGLIGLLCYPLTTANGRAFALGLIGASWFLCFVAKPTSAIAFVILTSVSLILVQRNNPKTLFIPIIISLSLFIFFSIIVDGSLLNFFKRFWVGLNDARIMGSHSPNSILNFGTFPLDKSQVLFLLILAIILAILIYYLSLRNLLSNALILLISCTCLLFCIYLFYLKELLIFAHERYSGIYFIAVPLGCIFFFIAGINKNLADKIVFEKLQIAAVFACMPYVYAVGTDRSYWVNASGVSIFWVLAGISLTSIVTYKDIYRWRTLYPICAISTLLTGIFIASSIQYPMRQSESLLLNSVRVKIGNGDLILSENLATYITNLRHLARVNGFISKTPIIDLTGISPGVSYILDGTSTGAAWLLGGYPGSNSLAVRALSSVSCEEIISSWLITSPKTPSSLDPLILERFGIRIGEDYVLLGSNSKPPGVFPENYPDNLLKPKEFNSALLASCRILKNNPAYIPLN